MKRLLLCTLIAAALPALAQVSTNPSAKVDPKNNKVSRPVVEKPKEKLMSRDELRACLTRFDKNETEAKDVKVAQDSYNKERTELLQSKGDLTKQGEALNASATEIKAERELLLKEQEGLKEQIAKLKRDEAEQVINAYKAKAVAHDVKVESYNKAKTTYADEAKAFDTKVETHNKNSKDMQTRTEAHLDAVDDWKAECSKKPYDEADEIAIRKELQQTKKP